MQRDPGLLQDILIAGREIQRFLSDTPQEKYLEDPLRQAAVQYKLAVIGEAAGNLTEDFRSSHPDIPWPKIRGLRNRLIHAYLSVEPMEIWRIVSNDLPVLLDKIEAILSPGIP